MKCIHFLYLSVLSAVLMPALGSPKFSDHRGGTTTTSLIYYSLTSRRPTILVCVDSRSSMGDFVSSSAVLKVIPTSPHSLATMAGCAADCSVLLSEVLARNEANFITSEERRIDHVSLKANSKALSDLLYRKRFATGGGDGGISMGTMLSGFEEVKGDVGGESDSSFLSPVVYYVDDEGVRERVKLAAVGSGSEIAIGVIDDKVREFRRRGWGEGKRWKRRVAAACHDHEAVDLLEKVRGEGQLHVVIDVLAGPRDVILTPFLGCHFCHNQRRLLRRHHSSL